MIEGVSIIVCCYNSAALLPETLKHLALQKITSQVMWEVIVVDNASTDNTAGIARSSWISMNQPTRLSIIQELKPGLSHARAAGMAAASYSIAIFCDDDNWMSDNYVQQAYIFMSKHPEAGVAGGWCDGVYEIPVKEYLKPMLRSLAIGKQGFGSQQDLETVYGAGMVIRKSCYEYITDTGGDLLLDDRKGNVLASGGDSELCLKAKLAGYAVLFDENLYFRHCIPPGRLMASYFFRLFLTHVSPLIVISQYAFIYNRGIRPYSSFYGLFMAGYIKRFFYFALKLPFGKDKFYNLISFLQIIKVLALVTFNYSYYKSFYLRIAEKKKALSLKIL